MPVKTFCSICDKDIAIISNDKIKSLTGKEICKPCSEYLKDMRVDMEHEREEYLQELNVMKKDTAKTYKLADSELTKAMDRCKSLYATRSAEIDNRLKDVL